MNQQGAYPLQWPENWPRTETYARMAGPNQMSADRSRRIILSELKKLNAEDIVISSDLALRRDGLPYAGQGAPKDPGIALYFKRDGQQLTIACDQYRTYEANLRAVGISLESLRRIERYGSPELFKRAVSGFKELPAQAIVTPYMSKPWHEVLGVSPDASSYQVRSAYRIRLLETHPDHGGTEDAMNAVRAAWRHYNETH